MFQPVLQLLFALAETVCGIEPGVGTGGKVQNRLTIADSFRFVGQLIQNCPAASVNTFTRGTTLYKNRINRARNLDEKRRLVDSLMLIHDLRIEYFGDDAKYGRDYILDLKARDVIKYCSSNREMLRSSLKDAVEAAIVSNSVKLDIAAMYFKTLCEDFAYDDAITSEMVLSEYERLTPYFDAATDENGLGQKKIFEDSFADSGAANCDNLEALFSQKIAANPDDTELLSQAVALMSRANCESDFFFQTTEKYYQVKPSAETALFLAQAFQNKKEFDKAKLYLHEAVKVEEIPAEKVKLYVRIAVVELAAQNFVEAAAAAKEAIAIEPENGYAYFILAQTYALGNGNCSGLAKDATFWAAYDTMNKAVSLLDAQPDVKADAQKFMATYRNFFPTAEECFFNELKEGSAYSVTCGVARGVSTIVRFRPQ